MVHSSTPGITCRENSKSTRIVKDKGRSYKSRIIQPLPENTGQAYEYASATCSLFLHQAGGPGSHISQGIGEDRAKRGQLIGAEKTGGLLKEALVTIGNLLEIVLHILRRTEHHRVRITGDAVREVERLRHDQLKQTGALIGGQRIVGELIIQEFNGGLGGEFLVVLLKLSISGRAQQRLQLRGHAGSSGVGGLVRIRTADLPLCKCDADFDVRHSCVAENLDELIALVRT